MKTTLTAHITIDPAAWRRVSDLASRTKRPLADVIGDLLDQASAEPVAETAPPKYEPPPLTRLWLRVHPGAVPGQD